jgi:hypothetical protein
MLGVFLLAWRTFGPIVAVWSLAPLTFSSNGPVWLSGRITGGHLPAAAWHAGAFCLLAGCLERGGRRRALALGAWCGFGLWLDSMFAVTLVGLAAGAASWWFGSGSRARGLMVLPVFLAAFAATVWPRPVGARLDPHDAYHEQFALMPDPSLVWEHSRLLGAECLPRLIAGHILPDLATEPDPRALANAPTRRRSVAFDPLGAVVTGLTLSLAGVSAVALMMAAVSGGSPASRAVVRGLLVSLGATLVGLVLNRNIFNSDNYRYLVTLLVPLGLGTGLSLRGLSRRGIAGRAAAGAVVLLLAVLMTWDLARWYARFGWVDARGWPVRSAPADPALEWLESHPEIGWVEGGYWDVYRLSFLTGGRVRGAPFSVYPNRFPNWRLEPGTGRIVLARATLEGRLFRDQAIREGGRVVYRARGLWVVAMP